MSKTIDYRYYDLEQAKAVRDKLTEKQLRLLKCYSGGLAVQNIHVKLLDEYGDLDTKELKDHIHRMLSPIEDLHLFSDTTARWRSESFAPFQVGTAALEQADIIFKEYTDNKIIHCLTYDFEREVKARFKFNNIDELYEIAKMFDPEQKENQMPEITDPEGYFKRKVEEALAAIDKVKEQKKNISELVFKVTEQEAIIKRLEAALNENRKNLVKTQEDAAALEAEVEKYKPAYELLKNIKELEL